MVPSSDRLPAPALKRRRNPVELSSQQEGGGTASSVRGGLDSLYDQGKSSTKPSSYTSSEDYTHSPGYLSVQNGGQLRYVGNSYWALVRGYEPLCDKFLRRTHESPEGTSMLHIDSLALASLLKLLPTQPVCNALLHSFLVGVRPIYPFIHVPTFRVDHDNFWQWYLNLETSFPNSKLMDDPTFLCLLFTVFYCGAMAAPPSLWAAGALRDAKRESILEQLKAASSSSLEVCHYLRYPTFHTLVASLFRHSFVNLDSEPFEAVGFVCVVVRIAQSMGMHRDGSQFGLNAIECELRRRVWWHILWLDLQNSILTGGPTCCGSPEAHEEVQMVSESRDRDLPASLSGSSSSSPAGMTSSASMLFAIGRFKVTHFERSLVNRLHTAQGLEVGYSEDLKCAAKKLQLSINALIARIPAEGIPERGFIPSRLVNASPVTHERLYGDSLSEPTIFTSWTRIMLTMFKTEVAILLQRISLDRENRKCKEGQIQWNHTIQLCITYLSNFLQLVRTPAFTPYIWFCSTYFAPSQSVFLILTYLEEGRNSEIANLAFYFVDEVINFFIPEDHTAHPVGSGKQSQDKAGSGVDSAQEASRTWTLLRAFRRSLGPSPESGQNRSKQSAPDYQIPPSPSASPQETSPSPPKDTSNRFDLVAMPMTGNLDQHFPGAAYSQFSTPSVLGPQNRLEHVGDSDADMMQSPFDPDAWSSLLARDIDGCFSFGQDLAGNPIPIPTPRTPFSTPIKSSALASAILEGSIGYFPHSAWSQANSTGKRATRNEEARGTRETGAGPANETANRISGGGAASIGSGTNSYPSDASASLGTDFSGRTPSESLWMDL